jgi:O-antigen/teichoic acid export membrane protein
MFYKDLKSKSINGAIWTFVDLFINKGSYFLTSIVLASIIGPQQFGLIGMITLFVTMGSTLIDSGMTASLLRTKDVTDQDYSTVFVTTVFSSLLVYFIIFFFSPYIARFYEQPILINVLKIYCLGFIINSIRIVHYVKLIRELQFKKITFLSLPGNVLSVIVSIYLAKNAFGVWSIVSLFIINQTISTIVFWCYIKWSPIWKFNFVNFKHHFKFGYKLLLSAQLNTVFENINSIIIGKMYDIRHLGYYDRAYTLNSYPVSVLSGIIMKVSLPTLAIIKDEKERLQKTYKNILQIAFFISASCFAFAAIIAKPLISILLGNEWVSIIPMFQILTISFVFYPLHSLNINLLSLLGRSDLFLKLELIKKILLILLIVIGYNFGIFGLIWSNVLSSVLALAINTYYSSQFLNYSAISQILDLIPTILIVLFTVIILFCLGFFIDSCSPYFNIMTNLLVGIPILVFTSILFKIKPFVQLIIIIKEHFIK